MGSGRSGSAPGRLLVCKSLKFGERFAVGRAVGNAFGGDDVRERSHVDCAAGDDAGLGPAAEGVEPVQVGLGAGRDPDQHVDVAGGCPPRRHDTVVEQVGVDRGWLDSGAHAKLGAEFPESVQRMSKSQAAQRSKSMVGRLAP